MDYRGQKLSENIYYFLTILFGVRCRRKVSVARATHHLAFTPPFRGPPLSPALLVQAIAWVVGFVQGDFTLTFYGWLGGLVLSLLVRCTFFAKPSCSALHDLPSFNQPTNTPPLPAVYPRLAHVQPAPGHVAAGAGPEERTRREQLGDQGRRESQQVENQVDFSKSHKKYHVHAYY
jgi:hypothetical protein